MFKDEKCTYKNTFAFGSAIRIFGIPLEEGKEVLKKQFAQKNLTEEKMQQNYEDLEH
ncbi:hypothetical protein IJU97_04475 [bacterium]|nr:hypothetical protein [bacterium]